MIENYIEILCPNCRQKIDNSELITGFCNTCNINLSQPVQNATVVVEPLVLFGKTF